MKLAAASSNEIQMTVRQNPATISEINQKQPSELYGTTFTCDARILYMIPTVDWYRNACPLCSHEIFPYGENWLCPTDGEFDHAKCMYQISAMIQDNTGELQVTINHEPATSMIGIQCSDLRIIASDHAIPPHILSLKGSSMTFHIEALREGRANRLRAAVKKVSDTNRHTSPTNTTIPSATRTTPAPTTLGTTQTHRMTAKRLEFPTQDTQTGGSKRPKTKE
uniref:uncharacterized protein LOC122583056 n=1 Tax=Erigeron canadensis TaxID=72917 RepID=UPI001CB8C6D0|nr:uncharacterized protein LOC122583056 [Erigeron canadensis]